MIKDLSQRLDLKRDLLQKNRDNQKTLESEKTRVNKMAYQLRSQEKKIQEEYCIKTKRE